MLNEWKKDLKARSLDETIRLSIGYAKSYNTETLVSQVELNDRLNSVEGIAKSNASFIVQHNNILKGIVFEIKNLKEKVKEK